MSNYRKTMGQAIEEMYPINEDNMDLMRKAAGGAMQKIKMKDGKLQMDSFTASAIMKVYDKVNPANQKKMATMINKGTKDGMMKLQDFAMKQVKSGYGEEVELDEVLPALAGVVARAAAGAVAKKAIGGAGAVAKKAIGGGEKEEEEVDLDEVDRSTYDDRIKKFTGMLKDAEKEKPLDKKWISMLKDKIKSTNADQRRLLGMSEDVDLDEGKMSQLHQYIKDKKSAEEIAKLMKVDVKTIKTLMSSNNPEDVEESAASDARRAMSRDKDLGRGKDSADDDDDATDDDVKGASKNIMMQLRKAQSLKGRFDVEFADGKKTKVSANIAMAVQQKYNAQKRPAEKEKFQAKIGKSYKDMLSALKEELQPKKESILERMNRKIKENKDG